MFRFIPDGIYLDACALGPEKLARQMNNAIVVKRKYYELFKWRSHYSFHSAGETPNTAPICKFCEMLNNRTRRTATSIYRNSSKWWNQVLVTYNLANCRISEPAEPVQPKNQDDIDPLSIISSVKNEMAKVLPNMYYTLRLWLNKMS